MKCCRCCGKTTTQCNVSLPLVSTSTPSSSNRNHSCKEDYHVSCVEEKRRNIHQWKEKHFPDSETTCGTIAFKGDTRQSLAECVHLYIKELQDEGGGFRRDGLQAVYELMTEKWKIPEPDHIISVVGGAKNFDVDEDILTDFKDTIRNISRTSRAWVITGGTHTGVMKHVGDALEGGSDDICIGIPVFSKICGNDQLIRKPKNGEAFEGMISYKTGFQMKADEMKEGAYLDSCHSHFLMYDDDQNEDYYGEIGFRAALENHITEETIKPYVLIALSGGEGTFRTICEVIKYDRSVVLVKGSGGVTDCLAEEIKGNTTDILKYVGEVGDHRNMLERCREKEHLFIVSESGEKISSALTEALLPTKVGTQPSTAESLRLALLWQDTSRLTRLVPINWKNWKETVQTNCKSKDLENLLVLALARGSVDFVKILLLDYEVAISDVLTYRVLKLLYGYQTHERNFPETCLEFQENFYEDSVDPEIEQLARYVYYYNKNNSFNDGCLILTNTGIREVRKKFCEKCPESVAKSVKDHPVWELFIWSVVSNLPDMAKVLWPLGEDQIGKALVASHYFEKVANRYERFVINDHQTEVYRENKMTFCKLACHLLDDCYKRNEKNATKLIKQNLYLLEAGKSNLELAVVYRNLNFVGHTSVQKVLNDVWAGKLDTRQIGTNLGYLQILLVTFLPFFMPIIKFNKDELDEKEFQKCCLPKCIGRSTWKIRHFYSAPVVGYLLNMVFQIAFVSLYSHCLVYQGMTMDVQPTKRDQLLYTMVVGLFTTELFQISQYDSKNICEKIKIWISDYDTHNFWDVTNLILFAGAVAMNRVLRLNGTWCGATVSSNTTVNATYAENDALDSDILCRIPHLIHAVIFVSWALRVCIAFRFFPKFGQYYEMVKLMLPDLLGFMIGMVILILTFGFFSTSMFYPTGQLKESDTPFLYLFAKPWFHIYGEYFIEMPDNITKTGESWFLPGKHRKPFEEYIAWVALGIYLIFTNIIFLNIVIATFNNTYERVMAEGTKIWKYNRYHVIIEYMKRCTSPPPFCIIQHAFLFIKWILCGCPLAGATSTSEMMNSKMSVDVSKLCEAEKVKLAQFQCDRALHIFKQDMKIIGGKVLLKELRPPHSTVLADHDDQGSETTSTKNETILMTLKELMIKIDEQNECIKELKKETEKQWKKDLAE